MSTPADSLTLPESFPESFPAATPGGPARAAADYYRRPERAPAGYRLRNVEQAQEAAGEVTTLAGLLAYFTGASRRALERLRSEDLERPVQVAAVGPMLLASYVATRVMSVAAHGLDVAISLARALWTTAPARRSVLPRGRASPGPGASPGEEPVSCYRPPL